VIALHSCVHAIFPRESERYPKTSEKRKKKTEKTEKAKKKKKKNTSLTYRLV
jgi:hypothetical protein